MSATETDGERLAQKPLRKPKTENRFSLFRSLKYRNFRLYFFGQFLSLTGTWMQQVAQAWLLYRLTHSAFLLGLIGFCGQIPVFILGLWGGAMADRLPKRPIIILTQFLSMLQAFCLAGLTLSGTLQVWMLFALSFFLGLVNAFDMPARQSYLIELSGKEDLPNAIALNSSMVNGTRVLGPALAGILIISLGEGSCFLINGLSYLAVLAGLLAMRFETREAPKRSRKPLWLFIREGIVYARQNGAIRSALLLLALISLFGLPYAVLMPVFAKEILGGGAGDLGLLTGAAGAGAMLGTLLLARRSGFPRYQGLEGLLSRSAAGFGAALILFSLSRNLWLSLVLIAFVGFGMMVSFAASNTLLQNLVQDEMRGRVMSLFTMTFMGMAPIGSLLFGALGQRIGAPGALALGGSLCLLGGLSFKGLPRIREGPISRPSPEPLVPL